MRHFFEDKWCARTLGIYYQIPPLMCDVPTTFSSTEKSSAQRFEIKTKNMGATPDKAVGVGSLTTRRTMKNHGRPYWKHYPSMAVLMQVPI